MSTLQASQIGTNQYAVQTRRRLPLPSAASLSYIKNLLEVFVLLIAVTWLVPELFHDPAGAARRMAGHQALK